MLVTDTYEMHVIASRSCRSVFSASGLDHGAFWNGLRPGLLICRLEYRVCCTYFSTCAVTAGVKEAAEREVEAQEAKRKAREEAQKMAAAAKPVAAESQDPSQATQQPGTQPILLVSSAWYNV